MENWRPDNWKNPYPEPKLSREAYDKVFYDIYEAGADAVLEGLKDEGVFTYGNHTPDIDLDDAPEVSGYWVFIPEEVKE